jgi:hypothetical protein
VGGQAAHRRRAAVVDTDGDRLRVARNLDLVMSAARPLRGHLGSGIRGCRSIEEPEYRINEILSVRSYRAPSGGEADDEAMGVSGSGKRFGTSCTESRVAVS